MGHGLTGLPPDISLRPATPEDRDFLLETYASTRAEELVLVPWTDAEKTAFLAVQFEAQDRHYRSAYPDGTFDVVLRGGLPIGRLYLARLPGEIQLVDIALLPAHRGAGVGTSLVRAIAAEADDAGLPIRLHVEPWNPARRMYERLGFRSVEVGPVYELMERPANSVS